VNDLFQRVFAFPLLHAIPPEQRDLFHFVFHPNLPLRARYTFDDQEVKAWQTHRLIAFNSLSKVTCCTNLSRGIKNRWNASVRSPIFVPTGNELLRPPTSQTFPQKRFSADILRLMNCFRYNCGMFTSRSVVTCIPALWRFYPWMRRPARSLRPLAVLRNLVAMPSACFDPGGESI